MSTMSIKRAILSVWNKDGIVPLAKSLRARGVDLFSTGGTFRALQRAGIAVTPIGELTRFPEIMNGRVKTLHPMVFAGLLVDGANPDHRKDLESVHAEPFELVVVNLYPFSQTLRSGETDPAKLIEMIDIGGPSMLRAAAKNHRNVVVLSDPEQYDEFRQRLEADNIDLGYRRQLAGEVFAKTTIYDVAIANYFQSTQQSPLPELLFTPFRKKSALRYGENPDQQAALYGPAEDPDWLPFQQLQGKEISYNNYIDCMSAYRIANGFEQTACVLIKHTNPCGFGIGDSPRAAYQRAVQTDPLSYYGGIVGINRPVDEALAAECKKSFLECIVAPEYTQDARRILATKKKLRLLIPDHAGLQSSFETHGYGKGALLQTQASDANPTDEWKCVTQNQPDEIHWRTLQMGWQLIKNVKSNAIVLVNETGAVGVGAGQMSRVDALKIAIRKAGEAQLDTHGCLMISDAFFPFRDSVDLAAEKGIRGIIQPGGSIRDGEVIEACNEHQLFMVFTGKRVFKH